MPKTSCLNSFYDLQTTAFAKFQNSESEKGNGI